MKMIVLATSALVLAATACAAPADDAPTDSTESALDATWQKLLTCDGGAAVLDVNGSERRNLQLVIRDQNIVRWLNQAGVVHSAYGATEVILSGWTGRVNWSDALGPRLEAQPYGAPGVFGVGDFHEMIANHDTYEGGFGSFVRVAREGAGVKVQFGTIEKRGCAKSETYYVGDGFGWQTSCVADYSAYVERANWYFQSCR